MINLTKNGEDILNDEDIVEDEDWQPDPRYPHFIQGYDIGLAQYSVRVNAADGEPVDTTGSLLYVAEEFANSGLDYCFAVSGMEDHAHCFDRVIHELLRDPKTFSIEGFEEDYSKQEIEMLEAVRKRALEFIKQEDSNV